MRNTKRRFTRPTIDEMEEFRQFLGPKLASGYSDGELKQLREDMHAAAEILLDLCLEKTKQDGSNPRRM